MRDRHKRTRNLLNIHNRHGPDANGRIFSATAIGGICAAFFFSDAIDVDDDDAAEDAFIMTKDYRNDSNGI